MYFSDFEAVQKTRSGVLSGAKTLGFNSSFIHKYASSAKTSIMTY